MTIHARSRSAATAVVTLLIGLLFVAFGAVRESSADSVFLACAKLANPANEEILRPVALNDQTKRFHGKVEPHTAICRGSAKRYENWPELAETPWVDWSTYWATGDSSSLSRQNDDLSLWDRIANYMTGQNLGIFRHIADRNERGIDGALLDLEYQRMELIRFNLFENQTFDIYIADGRSKTKGPLATVWEAMELDLDGEHREYASDIIETEQGQICTGELIRHRTVTGICNDIRNPAMGSTGMPFSRNVDFESTYPRLTWNKILKNRHGDRLGLMRPSPKKISEKLFTRLQDVDNGCNGGKGSLDSSQTDCNYTPANFFNVLAAYWIQFMTHDWFSHLNEARNDERHVLGDLRCAVRVERDGFVEMTDEERTVAGCDTADPSQISETEKMDVALLAEADMPGTLGDGSGRTKRARRTTQNFNTAWWDASQIYGYNARSRARMKRDPENIAKLLLVTPNGETDSQYGYLPVFDAPCANNDETPYCDPINDEWIGQEAVAFPDNWSIGLSFLHNIFAREHNQFVDAFENLRAEIPNQDSGLRDPNNPDQVIPYSKVSKEQLFEVARLVVSAEIAKIHTIEWTTQLLYNQPLHLAMNSNWSGLFSDDHKIVTAVTDRIVKRLQKREHEKFAHQFFSAAIAGRGIVGYGSTVAPTWIHDILGIDTWDIKNPEHVNGGTNHFGSPFNFPEEFVSVYRLHPLLPDLLEYRTLKSDPDKIANKIPIIETFRRKATDAMRDKGLASWALSLGRQRLGALVLQNHPQFLQNIDLSPRVNAIIDVAELDIIRDRERGIPRFNELRRQIGLRHLTSFDDFVDKRLAKSNPQRENQEKLARALRDVYGTHICDESKVISTAQVDRNGNPINDCLGHENGAEVDNIEDVDNLVGWLAESTRPHGFAISETQFHIFIINASRRLFSDRFFTSSFRPEFYSHLGIEWVVNNGPTGKQWEWGLQNGNLIEVSPMKRVLLRTVPELTEELSGVINAFDPWARERGDYYSLDWRPRKSAKNDEAFTN